MCRFSDINFLYTKPTMLIDYSAFCYRISCISKIRITTMTIETGRHCQRVASFTSRYSAAAWFYKFSSAWQCPHKCCLQLFVKSNEMNIYIFILYSIYVYGIIYTYILYIFILLFVARCQIIITHKCSMST